MRKSTGPMSLVVAEREAGMSPPVVIMQGRRKVAPLSERGARGDLRIPAGSVNSARDGERC